jgi:hypothetical protein
MFKLVAKCIIFLAQKIFETEIDNESLWII